MSVKDDVVYLDSVLSKSRAFLAIDEETFFQVRDGRFIVSEASFDREKYRVFRGRVKGRFEMAAIREAIEASMVWFPRRWYHSLRTLFPQKVRGGQRKFFDRDTELFTDFLLFAFMAAGVRLLPEYPGYRPDLLDIIQSEKLVITEI